MSNKKTIQINKDYLSISNRMSKKKNKTESIKKQKSQSLVSPKKMKREFIKKVKNFQQQRQKTISEKINSNSADSTEFENEFNKSLGFLQNMIDSKKNESPVPITLTVPKSLNSTNSKSSTTIKLPPPPPYSSMKNSSKPTYRQWAKTIKKPELESKTTLQIENKSSEPILKSERALKLEAFKNKIKNNNRNNRNNKIEPNDDSYIKKKIITKTYKRKLGKIGKTVSVLIKNKDTRRNVQVEKAKLAEKPIVDIKNFLKEKNLIKAGSDCPSDVLRCMYEKCILTGDVENNSSGNLIHNFINS